MESGNLENMIGNSSGMEKLIPVASVLHLISYYLSFYLPWLFSAFHITDIHRVVVYSSFYDSDSSWHTSIPVTLGITKCFTNPCIYPKIDAYSGLEVTIDSNLRHQFKFIRLLVVLLFSLSAALALLASIIYLIKGNKNLGWLRYIYPLSVCHLVLSSCIYFPFMYVNLNGGYFREGSILLLSSTSFGMGICSMYFAESHPNYYEQLP